ncbi:unnamed protein product [Lampetra planeri]
MSLGVVSLRTLVFLELLHTGRRSLVSSAQLQEQPKKIAVVGAGIGGTAAAYYLRQEFGSGVKIDVFEPGAVGISPRTELPSKTAIFDGKELTFQESDWFIVLTGLLLIHRIYQYQQYGYSFSSVEKLLHAMGGDSFLKLVNQTLEETMMAEGFSQIFLNDIVAPITRVNYGQSVRINGFVGAATSFYELNYVGDTGSAHSLYDIVVIATPLHQGKSDISFSGFSPPIPSQYPGRYHQTVSTLVHGLLNMSYLGSTEPASEFTVSDILTTDSKGNVIDSLSSIDPPLSQEQLRRMFISWDAVSETPWLAYPAYRPPHRRTPPFILHNRLYYLNAVEWAASAMEMSVISARQRGPSGPSPLARPGEQDRPGRPAHTAQRGAVKQHELWKGALPHQMEFEAAQKNEAAQLNVTEEQGATTRYLEAVQDGSVEERSDAEGGRTDSQCPESSEEADGQSRRNVYRTNASTGNQLVQGTGEKQG